MPRSLLILGCSLLAAGCITVKIDPSKPIEVHAVLDVNVKVDRALDDFFGDLDKKSSTITPPASKP
ncbi:MAG: hypothetical protein ABIV50_04130 [Opitutus sp.]